MAVPRYLYPQDRQFTHEPMGHKADPKPTPKFKRGDRVCHAEKGAGRVHALWYPVSDGRDTHYFVEWDIDRDGWLAHVRELFAAELAADSDFELPKRLRPYDDVAHAEADLTLEG